MAINGKTGITRPPSPPPIAGQPLNLLSDAEKATTRDRVEQNNKKGFKEYLVNDQGPLENNSQKHPPLTEEEKKARWEARQADITSTNQAAKAAWQENATMVQDFITSMEASQQITDSIKTPHIQELQQETNILKRAIRTAIESDAPKIFQEGLVRANEWCNKKAKIFENSTFNKIGKFLTSAIKVIHYTIHKDSAKASKHKNTMSQISNELSGKVKSFSNNSPSSAKQKHSFVEDLLKKSSVTPIHKR